MSDITTAEQSHTDGRIFRPLIGLLAIIGSLAGFGALFLVEVPEGNKDAMMLGLGVIFGWGNAVVQSEYGATTVGRKVAEGAVRAIERQQIASEYPTAPADAEEAAQDTADAAQKKADTIKGEKK